MTESTLVFVLIIVTFAAAIAFGAYQWLRAKKARREHHHSVAEKKEMAEAPVRRNDERAR